MSITPGENSGGALGNLQAGISTAALGGGGNTSYNPTLNGLSKGEQQNLLVYFGFGHGPTTSYDEQSGSGRMRRDSIQPESYSDEAMTVDQAMQMAYDPTQGAGIRQKLYKLGLIDSPNDLDAAEQIWSGAIQMAGRYYTNSGGSNKITPWQVLDMLSSSAAAAKAKANAPFTHTSTSTETAKFSDEDVKGYATSAYQSFLGRDPNAKEQAAVAAALRSYAAAHPKVTKSTTHGDGKGNDNTTTSTSGGVDQTEATQILRDQAQADPEYGAYQAATTYMSALEALIGSGGQHL